MLNYGVPPAQFEIILHLAFSILHLPDGQLNDHFLYYLYILSPLAGVQG